MNDLVAHGIPLANTDVNPVGTITAFAGSNPPSNLYMICDGRTLNVSDNPELFSVIGYTYGGSGEVFAIPNLVGMFLVGSSSNYTLGSTGGSSTVALTEEQMPSHTHLQDSHTHSSSSHTHTTVSHTHSVPTHTHTFTTGNQSINHTHSISITSRANSANHTHTWSGTTSNAGSHTHSMTINGGSIGWVYPWYNKGTNSGGIQYSESFQYPLVVGSSGSHTHTVSGTTAINNASHTHSVIGTSGSNSVNHTHSGTTASSAASSTGSSSPNTGGTVVEISSVQAVNQSTGGSQPHDNLPPYVAVNYIIKVK